MAENKSYFFCGIGGSGMLPLAMIVAARGAAVSGSDRSRDQGRTPEKFAWLESQGIAFIRRTAAGSKAGQILVASAAIEDSVPDVAAANALGLPRMTRADLNAALFNAADTRRSASAARAASRPSPGMIGWILESAGRQADGDERRGDAQFRGRRCPSPSALVGDAAIYVSEVDESDGSIALYRPTSRWSPISASTTRALPNCTNCSALLPAKARIAVVNADDAESVPATVRTRMWQPSASDDSATVRGSDFEALPDGCRFCRARRWHGAIG